MHIIRNISTWSEEKLNKKILFITGTRADYGKIKSLIKTIDTSEDFEAYVYVSGMHLLKQYGSTYNEVLKDNYSHVFMGFGQHYSGSMSYNLGNVICNLTGYVENINPDMIVVHGDRIDALAGAIVGAFSNIIVAHIEGGEITGTIDDSIRHAISKFSHFHFVSNEEAMHRLVQLGESKERIFIIGSPDIDLMMSDNLPSLEDTKKYYNIPFESYALLMYHPVTTEYQHVGEHISAVVDAVIASQLNYIVVYPNNDLGTEIIMNEYKRLEENPHYRIFPSLRFEYFLTLLKHSDFVIGNSSAGIRETGIYGIPSIDIGTRQQGRYNIHTLKNIQWSDENVDSLLKAIKQTPEYKVTSGGFGIGNSTELFMKIIRKPDIWNIDLQKRFVDIT